MDRWVRALTNTKGYGATEYNAEDLYDKGGYWPRILRVVSKARRQGFEPRLWVASAGYGLLKGTDRVVSYGATFAKNAPDTIFRSKDKPKIAQRWWRELSAWNHMSGYKGIHTPRIADIPRFEKDAFLLVVMTPPYIHAVERDLLRTAKKVKYDGNRFAIIGTKGMYQKLSRKSLKLLKPHLVPIHAKMQHAVGGGLIALHAYVAYALIREAHPNTLSASTLRKHAKKLLKEGEQIHKDTFVGDNIVRKFLGSNLPGTKTALYNQFKKAGYRCFVERFNKLYYKTLEEKGMTYHGDCSPPPKQ